MEPRIREESSDDDDTNCSNDSLSILANYNSLKTGIPSLAKMCLRVINAMQSLIVNEHSSSTDVITGDDHDALIRTDEDAVFQEEMVDYGNEVTLLKDSKLQPSFNTFIREIMDNPSSSQDILHYDDLGIRGDKLYSSSLISFSPSVFGQFEDISLRLAVINEDEENIPEELRQSGDGIVTSSEEHQIVLPHLDEDGDFSPDDNDTEYQPPGPVLSDTSYESNLENESEGTRKRAKRGRAKKDTWIGEANKIKRMKGESYEGRRKTHEGKNVFDVKKKKRQLEPRCSHTEDARYFKCHKITEEYREKAFKDFWNITWEAKKVWVKEVVRCEPLSTNSRREFNYKYTLNNERVCKQMFLNTFCVGEWTVQNWTKSSRLPLASRSTSRNVAIKEKETDVRRYLKMFLDKLPKLESHYCRKTTQKLYLEPEWNSKESLYREYLNDLTVNGNEAFKVSRFIFWEEFDAMNLSLFCPKKDECDVCCARKVGNLSDQAYTEHILRKDAARQEKANDKSLNDPTTKVFTFDLQAVLLAPALNASALYYKTKLKVHNFTIFDLNTSDGYCFIWNESEGGVTADEFATIIYNFLTDQINDDVRNVIFWSDGCTNQNRNAILANALLLAAVQKSITITHKYLEKGHTQMECDSMHATIERKLKNRQIFSPAQYIDVCRSARRKPYEVKYLEHTYFKKFSSVPYLNSIRPGKRVGDATVFDLRVIQYRSDATIFYKKNYSDEFTQLSKRIKTPSITDVIPPLYETKLLIPRSKYVHLQELKSVLPRDVHPFYDELPHLCVPNQRRNSNINCTCKITV